jgi:hypothetical protein
MSNQFQTRFFPKLSMKFWKHAPGGGFSGIKPETYLNNHDLISKFRFFEKGGAAADSSQDVNSYLDVYHSGPLTKAEMLNRIADGRGVD